MSRQKNIELVLKSLKSHPNFPKPGVLFRDIFSVLGNPEAMTALYAIIREDCEQLRGKVTAVCALDSRGFLFGPQIAMQLQIPFIPIRKKGKLPGDIISVKYELEYGTDELQVQTDTLTKDSSVLIVDDLLATGGSLKAAGKLMERLGCSIERCYVIMELKDLGARETMPYPIKSIISL